MHHAKRAVIDWHAALYPGLDAPAVRALEAVLAEDLDRGNARLVRGRAATPRAAALIQGTAAHAAEIDDSFRDAMVHPVPRPSRLRSAAAQSVGANGSAFLRGVVLGYEVSTRIGVAMGRAHYQYWHNTGTIGTFGAAAAAGALLGLDEAAFPMRSRLPAPSRPDCSRPSDRRRWPSRCMPAAPPRPACWQRSSPRAACAVRWTSSKARVAWGRR
jgi:2-methylcitrate dehydratase PrpD